MGMRRRAANLARAALGTVIALGMGWAAASFVPLYEALARDADASRGVAYLPWAQVAAWAGILASILAAVAAAVEKVRSGQPVAWTPLLAVPLIVESWLIGLVLAMVLVSL